MHVDRKVGAILAGFNYTTARGTVHHRVCCSPWEDGSKRCTILQHSARWCFGMGRSKLSRMDGAKFRPSRQCVCTCIRECIFSSCGPFVDACCYRQRQAQDWTTWSSDLQGIGSIHACMYLRGRSAWTASRGTTPASIGTLVVTGRGKLKAGRHGVQIFRAL